jgi:hypothetical protein
MTGEENPDLEAVVTGEENPDSEAVVTGEEAPDSEAVVTAEGAGEGRRRMRETPTGVQVTSTSQSGVGMVQQTAGSRPEERSTGAGLNPAARPWAG